MAVSFKAEYSRTSEYRFFPEDIKIRPELNGRHDLPDIEELIASIVRDGQSTPVVIRRDGDKPVLVAGFSRWRAVSEINKRKLLDAKLQLRCTYTACSESEGFLANIAENRFRNTTTDIDDAHNIKRLMNRYQYTEEQVAQVYFPLAHSPEQIRDAIRWVKKKAQLIQLTPEAERAFKQGRLKGSAAFAIAKLSEELQSEVLKKDGKIDSAAIRHAQGKNGNGAPKLSLKQAIEQVIETGKFVGIGGKEVAASDDLVEFLGSLMGKGKK